MFCFRYDSPMTSGIRSKRLTARPRGFHGKEQTTSRVIWKYFESIFQQSQIVHFNLLEWNLKNCCVKLIITYKINSKTLFRVKWGHFIENNFFCIFSAYFKTFLHILVDFCAYLCAYLTKNSCIKFLSLLITPKTIKKVQKFDYQ